MSWVTLYPQWYVKERQELAYHYPQFRVDESELRAGVLILHGELEVRPSTGTVRYPVKLAYPEGSPYEKPIVTPINILPEMSAEGIPERSPSVRFFDRRHQMADGGLCLFQRETRAIPGGDIVRGIDALNRAEQWFLGFHAGHWPPDCADSELESHFLYGGDVLLGNAFFAEGLDGYGKFYLIPDFRRAIDRQLEDVFPMIVTALTEESSGLTKVIDARGDLSEVYPWIKQEAWDPTKVAEIYSRGAKGMDGFDEGY